MNCIDIYHDPGHGRLAHLLATMPNLATYLGNEKVAEDHDVTALPDHAFADPARRLFPIHTPKMAALSGAYARAAMLDGVKIPAAVQLEIKTACDAYGLDERSLFMVAVPVEKTAAAEDCLFPEQRMYPIRTATEIKTAEERLLAEHTKLLPGSRVAAFARLFKRATALGVELTPTSYKYAGFVATDVAKLRDLLRARAVACGTDHTKTAEAFDVLAEHAGRRRKPLSRVEQLKLAQTVSDLDESAGLVRHYDRALPDPVVTVFNTEKTASAGVDLGDDSVSMTKLMALDPSFYADALGSDFLPDITTGGQLDSAKLAEVLPTLPRDMKMALASALRSAGR